MIWNKEPKNSYASPSQESPAQNHLEQAKDALTALLEDDRLDANARGRLNEDYRQLKRLLDKVEKGHIYIAVFGRVSVGKSALLNALVGKKVFATSVLHGETKHSAKTCWEAYDSGGVYLLDTPGIDEVDGDERARIANEVAKQSDIVLFVVDGDMTALEREALTMLYRKEQPVLLVLNKADRLTEDACTALLQHLRRQCVGMIAAEHVISASAEPDMIQVVVEDASGHTHLQSERPEADVAVLREALWTLLATRGQSYAALNATVFADALSEKIGNEIVQAKRDIAEKIIRQYALFKAVGVAVNPIPLIDLLAMAADAGMIVHLSKVYGISITRHEAGSLISSMTWQTGMLLGTVYGVNALSSVLKGLTGGLSTVITAGAQAGVAFYGSYVIGKAAERYFAQGASWGERGAKHVIRQIIEDLDKDELMKQAKSSVREYLGKQSS